MNGQANTQLVKQAYQLFKAGNIQSFVDLLAEDVVWYLPEMTNVPFAGTWRGRQQVGQFFKVLSEVQDVVEFEPEEFIAQSDKVVVLGHFTMHVKATGRALARRGFTFWTIEAGSIKHVREYVDTLTVSRAHDPRQTD